MKNLTLAMGLWLCAFCLQATTAIATNAAGGDITYQWISDSTYKFTISFYRDCSGGPEKDTLPLCFYNNCTSSGFTVFALKATGTNGQTVPLACNLTKTKCDSAASTVTGYRHWKYTAVVTLPTQCNLWKASTFIANRNNAINIASATSTPLYLETTLNNAGIYQGNSSPQFSNPAIAYVCKVQATTFNNMATDPDGDSLVTESIVPRTGVTSCFATPGNVSYAAANQPYPAYNPNTNPIQTGNTFTLNSLTGQMALTPALTGSSSAAIRIKEYRNGILIGTVDREMQYQVYDCTISYGGSEGCYNGCIKVSGSWPNDWLLACAGQPFSFCVDFVRYDTNGTLLITDNHAIVYPGATVTYSSQMTDSVRAVFSFSPTVSDAGVKSINFTIADMTCTFPGIVNTASYTYQRKIDIRGPFKAFADTTICKGDTVSLGTQNGADVTWTAIPGGVLCTACPYMAHQPTVPTKYIATTTAFFCFVGQKDTVSVDFYQVNDPVVTIAATDTVITPGENVILTATPSFCNTPSYQWKKNGVNIPGATAAIYQSSNLWDLDTITCLMTCSDTCIIDTISNSVIVHVLTGIDAISTSTTQIYPNPNNGAFTLATATATATLNLQIINTLGQVVWSQQRSETGSKKTMDIQTRTLPEGHYILKVDDNRKTDVLRFSIVR